MSRVDIQTMDDLWSLYGATKQEAADRFGISTEALCLYTEAPKGWVGVILLDVLVAQKTVNPALLDLEGHKGAPLFNELINQRRRIAA